MKNSKGVNNNNNDDNNTQPKIQYKTRQDWMEKVINWKLYKKLKFDHTNKWYMHNLEYVLDSKTHKLL